MKALVVGQGYELDVGARKLVVRATRHGVGATKRDELIDMIAESTQPRDKGSGRRDPVAVLPVDKVRVHGKTHQLSVGGGSPGGGPFTTGSGCRDASLKGHAIPARYCDSCTGSLYPRHSRWFAQSLLRPIGWLMGPLSQGRDGDLRSDELIICTLNRPGELERCLDSVTEQTCLPSMVRVVNTSENSDTQSVVDRYAAGSSRDG